MTISKSRARHTNQEWSFRPCRWWYPEPCLLLKWLSRMLPALISCIYADYKYVRDRVASAWRCWHPHLCAWWDRARTWLAGREAQSFQWNPVINEKKIYWERNQDGRVEGRALTPSCENTRITTTCWTVIDRKTLELTKKHTPHPKQRRSHNETVGGAESQ